MFNSYLTSHFKVLEFLLQSFFLRFHVLGCGLVFLEVREGSMFTCVSCGWSKFNVLFTHNIMMIVPASFPGHKPGNTI